MYFCVLGVGILDEGLVVCYCKNWEILRVKFNQFDNLIGFVSCQFLSLILGFQLIAKRWDFFFFQARLNDFVSGISLV